MRFSGICQIAKIATPVLLLALSAGCDGATDKFARQGITGKVTLDGQPLAKGTISFDPDATKPDQKEVVQGGAVITAGYYSIDKAEGLTPGKYRVSIQAVDDGPGLAPGETPGAPAKPSTAPPKIPPQYNSKTTLSVEVKPGGGNDFPFDLKSK